MLQRGDRVFFSNNSAAGPTGYSDAASQTIRALGLVPLVYEGAGLNVRNSNLDREIRDDFYQSKVVVLLLGTGQRWRSIEDNWAIPELEHAISIEMGCFVYVTAEMSEEELTRLQLPIDAVVVRDEDHFAATLRQNLEQLMITSF